MNKLPIPSLFFIFSLFNQIAYPGGASSTLNSQPAEKILYMRLCSAIEANNLEFIATTVTTPAIASLIPEKCQSLLQIAIILERADIVRLLIQKGALINAQNFYGDTALHTVMREIKQMFGSFDLFIQHSQDNPLHTILFLLYKAGACGTIKNNEGKIPCDYLAESEEAEDDFRPRCAEGAEPAILNRI